MNSVHKASIDFSFDIQQRSSSTSLVASELSGVYRAGKQERRKEREQSTFAFPPPQSALLSLTRFLNILSSPITLFFAGA
jgi:hypothetical protein